MIPDKATRDEWRKGPCCGELNDGEGLIVALDAIDELEVQLAQRTAQRDELLAAIRPLVAVSTRLQKIKNDAITNATRKDQP